MSIERRLVRMELVLKSDGKRPNSKPLRLAFFGLVLFMVVYFARPEDWITGLAAFPVAKITGILIFLALPFALSNIRWHLPPEVLLLCLLVGQLWLTVPFSPVWRGGAFNVMLDFSKVLPVIIIIYGTVRSMNRLRQILFVQGACVAAIAVASIVNRHMSAGRLEGILSSVYGNPNDLAFVIDLSLPLCLALALTTRSFWKRLAWIVVMLAMIYTVFLTASRGGAIALGVAALVCLWQLGVKSRRFHLLLLIPAAALVLWLYGGNAVSKRFDQTNLDSPSNRDNGASESARQRKELLIRSLRMTAQHPLFGVGPGNFEIVSGVWRETHNSYTQVSAEGGIPAFLLYLLLLWRGIHNLREVSKRRKTEKSIRLFSGTLAASLAAYIVGSFFASDAYQMFPYLLIAYIGVLRLIVRRDRTVVSEESKVQPTSAQIEISGWLRNPAALLITQNRRLRSGRLD